MADILKELNDNQREAVINYNGPTLVIAGAGSGKTRVLTYRIAYMLQEGIAPYTILALTFTNKAAREMKERIALLVGHDIARRLWMGTFHSIFSKILRYESHALGYPSDYTIYDTIDSRNLIKTIIRELNLDEKIYKASEIQSRISMAKNNLVTAEAYAKNPDILNMDTMAGRPRLGDIYIRYAARCKRAGAMDFDDLLMNTNILFKKHPEILKKYQQAFNFVLVDEYQDTNFSQYLIINALADEHRNICAVGDDAQSIYSFRGARIENILKFKSDYPDSKMIVLEVNYRSTGNIVNAANSIISRNKDQISKKVYSNKDEGDKIRLLEAQTDKLEGNIISGMIKDMVYSRQMHYRDFAILYRTNAQSRIFEESLRIMNIPYRVYGGLSFYQRKEIKDVLAYFRVILNPSDDESLKRIINYPLRGIGKSTVSKVEMLSQVSGKTMWEILNDPASLTKELNSGTIKKLASFVEMINYFRKKVTEMKAFDLAYSIAGNVGLIKELSQDKTPEGISRLQNLEELLNSIKEFTDNEENADDTSLSAFLQTVTLYTDADTNTDDDNDKVPIMTIHSAKGLEFRCVFITGVEEDLFPSYMTLNSPKELEEERRLFYVAITRAMENVFISYASTRLKWGLLVNCRSSRFISEIDEQFIEQEDAFNPVSGQGKHYLNNNLKSDHSFISNELQTRRKLIKINESQSIIKNNVDHEEIMAGMHIEHERFGKGKVISKEGFAQNTKITVFFKDHGQKQLLLKFARLKIIS